MKTSILFSIFSLFNNNNNLLSNSDLLGFKKINKESLDKNQEICYNTLIFDICNQNNKNFLKENIPFYSNKDDKFFNEESIKKKNLKKVEKIIYRFYDNFNCKEFALEEIKTPAKDNISIRCDCTEIIEPENQYKFTLEGNNIEELTFYLRKNNSSNNQETYQISLNEIIKNNKDFVINEPFYNNLTEEEFLKKIPIKRIYDFISYSIDKENNELSEIHKITTIDPSQKDTLLSSSTVIEKYKIIEEKTIKTLKYIRREKE